MVSGSAPSLSGEKGRGERVRCARNMVRTKTPVGRFTPWALSGVNLLRSGKRSPGSHAFTNSTEKTRTWRACAGVSRSSREASWWVRPQNTRKSTRSPFGRTTPSAVVDFTSQQCRVGTTVPGRGWTEILGFCAIAISLLVVVRVALPPPPRDAGSIDRSL